MLTLKAKMNSQDVAIVEYLTALGVIFSAKYVCETTRDGWACDEWRVKLVKRAESGGKMAELATAYYTGTGHRASKTPMPQSVKINPRSLHAEQWFAQNVRPMAPTAASVLYSLILDAASAEQNFLDWCDEYGYDSDSRKALGMHEACCETRRQIAQVFSKTEQNHLQTLLEDY